MNHITLIEVLMELCPDIALLLRVLLLDFRGGQEMLNQTDSVVTANTSHLS